MKPYSYYVLNVFSERGVKGGNQLAVLPDAGDLSEEQMLSITKQFNFSESTFVTSFNGDSCVVRIFTPEKEIEYAGHPTIGTLNVIEKIHRETNPGRTSFTLRLKGGDVLGKFTTKDDKLHLVGFEQIPATFTRYYENRSRLLDILGISEDDLADQQPFHVIGVTKMQFLFVQLKSAETLKKINPNLQQLCSQEFEEEDLNVYVFTKEGLDGGNLRARFFVPLYGIKEDPATGGIQSSFGLCLHMLGLLSNNSENKLVVEQGYEMGRPSKIYNSFSVQDGKLIKTETSGLCYYFSRGELWI